MLVFLLDRMRVNHSPVLSIKMGCLTSSSLFVLVLPLATYVSIGFANNCTVFNKIMSDSYLEMRKEIIEREIKKFSGGNIVLNEKERKVNEILMKFKYEELEKSYQNSTEFLPGQLFYNVKEKIEKSDVFKIIKCMPKGASLHNHFLASVNIDYVIKNYTYQDNLYGAYFGDIFKLKFFKNNPGENWKLLKTIRNESKDFDLCLKKMLTISKNYSNIEENWVHFRHIFSTLYDLISYKPIFEDFVYQMLKENYIDNIFYIETRSTFTPIYDLTDKNYITKDFFETFISIVDKFKKEHTNFIGLKYIHSIYRGVEKNVLVSGLKELMEMKKLFPNFIAGLDLVGFEDDSNMLVDYHRELLKVRNEIKFFFHAGESQWLGYKDYNLVDAILLNSSRIGHGMALSKHPVLMEMVKSKNIAIELCPIANQLLNLNSDPRNHPIVNLLSNSFIVVVCNDDPAVWEATGLSYDFYVTFLGMTLKTSGLEILKKFANDSINYSEIDDKDIALKIWDIEWNKFLDKILEMYK